MLASSNHAQPSSYATFHFWFWWLVGTTLAGTITFFGAGALVTLRAESDTESKAYGGSNFMTGDFAFPYLLLWGVLIIILVGPSIGLTQGLVLQRVLGSRIWYRWLIATGLGLAIGLGFLGIDYLGPVMLLVTVAVAQLLVLKGYFSRAGWWLVWTCFAGLAGLAIANIASQALPRHWISPPSWPFYPLTSVLYWSVIWGTALIVYSSVSGLALMSLLRRSGAGQRHLVRRVPRATDFDK